MYYFALLSWLNFGLAVVGLGLAVLTIGLFVDLFIFKGQYFSVLVEKFAWPILMLTTFGSVVLSLTYSEYFGFIPCSLCWLQRIAIYPQSIMSVIAFKTKDKVFFPLYGIALSSFGFVVAVYQYIYQMVPPEVRESGIAPCLVDSVSSDCADKVIDEFGFVTFPFLSAVTFAFLIAIYLYLRRSRGVMNA